MIKASAGGGGRGMRLVEEPDQLLDQLRTARSEALGAFGSAELILEKAVLRPRHVEIQVFGDRHGNLLYLGERDCSVQRRHQKVIEEAPCPVLDADLRRAMGEAAVKAAASVNYVGAGTVEFLLGEDGRFYFLEMNTRLQVEHPVTELVTGQDLVAWQIRVAEGHPLPLRQEQVELRGHAIEVRLYAEDAGRGFLPQTGTVLRWDPELLPGVRIDHGLVEGQAVTPFYDPMLAKLIAYGATRDEARRKLIRALERCVLLGVDGNQRFLANLLAHPDFAAGEATTAFIGERFAEDPSLQPAPAGRRGTGPGRRPALPGRRRGQCAPARPGRLAQRRRGTVEDRPEARRTAPGDRPGRPRKRSPAATAGAPGATRDRRAPARLRRTLGQRRTRRHSPPPRLPPGRRAPLAIRPRRQPRTARRHPTPAPAPRPAPVPARSRRRWTVPSSRCWSARANGSARANCCWCWRQ
ncbi:geranyl-CoA carboxylase, subunit alpha (biotin-containing) [Pseudomonas aeruginosa]|nr:geranyl-CoA carboxylase, subunit alpha (biotin-containing) [Pseudomonas aeruginosa]